MRQFILSLTVIAFGLTVWVQAESEPLEVSVFTSYTEASDLSPSAFRYVSGNLEILNPGKDTLTNVSVAILMRDGYGKSLDQYGYEHVKKVWKPRQSLKTTWSWYNPTNIDVFLPLLMISGTDGQGKPFEFTVNRQVGESPRSIDY